MKRSVRSSGPLSGMAAGFLLVLAFLWLPGCRLARPFQSAEASRECGQGDAVIGLTYAKLTQRGEQRSRFHEYSAKVINSLDQQTGYLGHALQRSFWGDEVWTMTVWRDRESLDGFVRSEVHREAIRQGFEAVADGKFASVSRRCEDLPMSRGEAERILVASDRDYHFGRAGYLEASTARGKGTN